MQLRVPAAIVFDCDGTLVDSEGIHAKALQGALERLGVRLTVEEIRSQSAGIANGDYLSRVAAERRIVFPAHAERLVEDIADRLIDDEIKLIEGADSVVTRLAEKGMRLAVASNSSRRLVEHMLRAVRLAGMFAGRIATRDDVTLPKPAPDVYRHAARMLDVRAEDCLAVEDSPVGVAAARAAGMTVVGFRPDSSFVPEYQLTDAGASMVIKRLGEISSWLDVTLSARGLAR
jgi:HAD superfamily hydrolase (TIGR01509 family)